jgi:hypothetical protein
MNQPVDKREIEILRKLRKEVIAMRQRIFIPIDEVEGDQSDELVAMQSASVHIQEMIRASYKNEGYQRALIDVLDAIDKLK